MKAEYIEKNRLQKMICSLFELRRHYCTRRGRSVRVRARIGARVVK